MKDRYARALCLTEPKIAAQTPGTAVEGYWVDERSFFFLKEDFDASIGRIASVPAMAHAETGRIEELMPLGALAELLSSHVNENVELATLCSVQFDMPERNALSVSFGGRDFLIDLRRREVTQMRASLELPALFSPDGRHACIVKGFDLWLRDRVTGAERALSTGGALHHSYGQQSETSLSAVSYRQRPSPVGLWSSDSQWFLTHRIDERAVPELPLVEHAPPGGGRPVLHRYKYPMPGDPLPVATFVAFHVASGRTVVFGDFLVPITAFSPFSSRRVWFNGADAACFVRLDRYCRHAELIRLDLNAGTGRVLLEERVGSGYIDLNPMFVGTPNVRTLVASDEVIWYSERDGWGHLYLYDAATGAVKNQITRGNWLVRDIVCVDELSRRILFLANGVDSDTDPARKVLCAVNLDGTGFEVLLSHDGDTHVPLTEPAGPDQDRAFRPANAHSGVCPSGRFAVVRFASVSRGNRTQIVDLQSDRAITLASALPKQDEAQPRHFTAFAADGNTRLHGVLFLPSDFDASQRYPLIDYIYPGPQVAHQAQSYRALNSAHALALAELGFITMMLDTRAMPIGSRVFHQMGYGTLLEPQLSDHAAVVRQLCERHAFIDRDRVGMLGHSGGGNATARALCDYADLFKVGVAACGNHDSNHFSALWSDKYRGPGAPERWAAQANGAVAGKLVGKLLLIHGELDEAVHVSQTLGLVDALIRANRDFDLLIVPNEGHSVLMTNGYAIRRMWDYFVRHLLGATPPADFEIRFEPYEMERFVTRCLREARNP
jgi:fermentation-respiration switch protein FrsA (DUF1100 family)